MKEYAWEILDAGGEATAGADKMPSPSERSRCRLMRLSVPVCPVVFRAEVPEGGRLIFFRQNQIDQDAYTGQVLRKSFAYYLGFRRADGSKCALRLEPVGGQPGAWRCEPRDDDERGELDAQAEA